MAKGCGTRRGTGGGGRGPCPARGGHSALAPRSQDPCARRGRLARGAGGAAEEGAGVRAESRGHGEVGPQHRAGVGGGSAGQVPPRPTPIPGASPTAAGARLTPSLPSQAVAGGQGGAGEAAAVPALDADASLVAPPGAGGGPAGLGSPRLPVRTRGSCNKALKQTAVAASWGVARRRRRVCRGARKGCGAWGGAPSCRDCAGTPRHGANTLCHHPAHTCPGWQEPGAAPAGWGGPGPASPAPAGLHRPSRALGAGKAVREASSAAPGLELRSVAPTPPALCPPPPPTLGAPTLSPPASTAKTE